MRIVERDADVGDARAVLVVSAGVVEGRLRPAEVVAYLGVEDLGIGEGPWVVDRCPAAGADAPAAAEGISAPGGRLPIDQVERAPSEQVLDVVAGQCQPTVQVGDAGAGHRAARPGRCSGHGYRACAGERAAGHVQARQCRRSVQTKGAAGKTCRRCAGKGACNGQIAAIDDKRVRSGQRQAANRARSRRGPVGDGVHPANGDRRTVGCARDKGSAAPVGTGFPVTGGARPGDGCGMACQREGDGDGCSNRQQAMDFSRLAHGDPPTGCRQQHHWSRAHPLSLKV